MTLILATFYFLFPAAAANMTPVLVSRLNVLPMLAKPIDGGYKLWGEFVFGTNKTWRGFILGTAAAVLVSLAQFFLWQFHVIREYSLIDFTRVNPLTFGIVGGIGALGGDLIKSFIKRRFRIKSGMSWPIFDQLDFIVGYFALTSLFVNVSWTIFFAACIIALILHPLTNLFAYLLNVKSVWW